ncbi:MAG: epimerase [Acidobacteria bacterium]|nr:MAG: epimerase [Acidobacteriota bacterium]
MNENPSAHKIFIAGGTGYMGRRLVAELLKRGHSVRALVRKGSEGKLPPGCAAVVGDALVKESYAREVRAADAPADTFVQLVGVSHPNPSKADEFRAVDLASARAAVSAAVEAGIQHFVYVSVAQPAPVMKAYVAVRGECEEIIRKSGLNATILRPWYVLGPGHRWPYLLVPLYWLFERLPGTRESARRLGLVSIDQMVRALVGAVEHPCQGIRILGVPDIRQA